MGASHVVADQSSVFAFLTRGENYGCARPVTRIDTHGAVVFLAGENAYKVKRAVHFPFMDFSTLEARRVACGAELAVNAPNAPGLYLRIVPITRSEAGFALGGDGPAVEWAVHMRRFDESCTLDRVAEGGLSSEVVAQLARAVLAAHAKAPRRDGAAAVASLAGYIAENRVAFLESPEVFPVERVARLTAHAARALDAVRPLLLHRGAAGYVRRCHGDLHLRNIVLLETGPTLFDAIEFDDAIATGDVLYDLAFLLMDLWKRGLTAEASRIFNCYLWESDEANLSGLAALPLFLSLRAAIRAKVGAANLPNLAGAARETARAEVRSYFGFAERFLEPAGPRLVAVGGLSGTGKSTLAAAVAPGLRPAPGAVHLRSDVVRKRIMQVGETARLPPEGYSTAVTHDVYAALRRQTALALRAGYSVVVDAVHAEPAERAGLEAVARQCGVTLQGFWLEAPLSTLLERVERRSGDASDADAAVVAAQAGHDLGIIAWQRLDAAKPVCALRRTVIGESTDRGDY